MRVVKFVIQGHYLQHDGSRHWLDWTTATNLEQALILQDHYRRLIDSRTIPGTSNAARIVKRVTRDEVVNS